MSAGWYDYVYDETTKLWINMEFQGPLEPMKSKLEHKVGTVLNICFGGILLPGGDVRRTRKFIRELRKAGYEITKLRDNT